MDDEDDGEEPEEVIVERAMARIREAKSQGRGDVDLTPTEVAALTRMQERKKKEAERRRQAEKRVSIPLSSFELDDDDGLPEHPPPGVLDGRTERQAYPPVGYFPPPSAVQPQSRKHSGTSSHRGRRGEDEMYMLPAASAPSLDPDYYMSNAGPHAPPGAIVAAHRTFSGPQPRSRRHGDSSDEGSGDETASDEYRDGGARGRREAIIVEAAAGDRSKTPDLRRSSRRTASKSPAKRTKPAAAEKDKGKTASATSTKSRKKR